MDRPFKTVDEQIEILHFRGMSTDEKTPHILEREGYYSVVNGYKDLFIDPQAKSAAGGEDRFKKGTAFSDLYRLFEFDRDLRMTMFRYFAIAEATLKTVCSYEFAKAYQLEAEPYLERQNYRLGSRFDRLAGRLIEDFEYILGKNPNKQPRFRRQYLEHYLNNHDEVPIWVLMNYLSLGQVFKFYDYQPESLRNAVAKKFTELYNETHAKPMRIHDRQLRLIYDHIKDFRNICAHDERLYCARVAPSKDVSLADVLKDLRFVLTKQENTRMGKEVMQLILGIANDLDQRILPFDQMGINTFEEVFFVSE
ncbi:MAG: Abi family protein [Eggerthellaceae bacterium]